MWLWSTRWQVMWQQPCGQCHVIIHPGATSSLDATCRQSFSPCVVTVSRHVSSQFYATWQHIKCICFRHRTWQFSFSSQNMAIFIMKITSLSSQNVHRKHHWFLIFITKVHKPLHITDHRTCHLHHHHKSTQTIAHNRSLNLPSSSQVTEVQHISSTHRH